MIDCWKQLTWKNRSHKTILQITFALKCVWHDYRILFWSHMFLLLMAVCELMYQWSIENRINQLETVRDEETDVIIRLEWMFWTLTITDYLQLSTQSTQTKTTYFLDFSDKILSTLSTSLITTLTCLADNWGKLIRTFEGLRLKLANWWIQDSILLSAEMPLIKIVSSSFV